jgi:hypothetical protein
MSHAKSNHADYRYAECRYAGCHGAFASTLLSLTHQGKSTLT